MKQVAPRATRGFRNIEDFNQKAKDNGIIDLALIINERQVQQMWFTTMSAAEMINSRNDGCQPNAKRKRNRRNKKKSTTNQLLLERGTNFQP